MSQELTFGGWLRQRRTELGVTRDELSERVGFSRDLLRKLESGERRPSGQIAYLLAEYFHVPGDEREAFVTFARTGQAATPPPSPDTAKAGNSGRPISPWRRTYVLQTNLPAMLTPLIGREQEVSAVRERISNPKTRLLTLTGAPGIGKTSLGLQAAWDLMESFEDGVYFVDLAPVTDPDVVLATVAAALGLKEDSSSSFESAVHNFVRERKLLLMLDNFEQVLDAATSVVEMLKAGPWLKALVTSREALHVSGERRFSVPPLRLPGSGQLQSPQELLDYASVELFVERSIMSRPDFALTEQNAPAVARICLALDGLPLAIELAAGHAGLLAPHEIEERLGSRLQILKTKARDLPDRHRTLRGAIEWSYNLLGAEEQALFRRMGVFVGGCTLRAAGAVAWPDPKQAETDQEVAEALETLLNKSMITRSEAAGDHASLPASRFSMLETLREYALEQLADCGEEEETRDKHARYFLALVQEGGDHIVGVEVVPWLERVKAEYNNLREALAWLLDEAATGNRQPASKVCEKKLDRIQLASDFCTALFPFWNMQTYVSEAHQWFAKVAKEIEALVEATRDGDDWKSAANAARELSPELPAIWARMLTGVGAMAYYRGDYEEARIRNEEGLALRRQIGDIAGVAACLNNLGIAATDQGDTMAARGYLSESLAIARELDVSWKICAALGNLAIVATNTGSFDEARVLLEESLSIGRVEEDKVASTDALGRLGVVARLQGDYVEARRRLGDALDLSRQRANKGGIAQALLNLGLVARDEGDYAAAHGLLLEGLPIVREEGNKRPIAEYLEGLASVATGTGRAGVRDLGRSARLYGAAEALREAIKVPLSQVEQRDYERYLQATRANSGAAAWSAAWAEGRAMTLEETVAYALSG